MIKNKTSHQDIQLKNQKQTMNLILFTQSFPYTVSNEHQFLNQEIPFLSESFDSVNIIPETITAERVEINFKNVNVSDGFSSFLKNRNIAKNTLMFMMNTEWWAAVIPEFANNRSLLFSHHRILKMLKQLTLSLLKAKWIKRYIVSNNLQNGIFYTYWFTNTTTALTFVKNKHKELKIYTRTHNVDLFKERQSFGYFPLRTQALKRINKVFPCMNSGTSYLKKTYPNFSSKIITSYLGTYDHNLLNQPSKDGVFRILSCSTITPVKRVHLIAAGIQVVIKKHKIKQIEWVHFGDGPLKAKLMRDVQDLQKNSIKIDIRGHVSHNEIIQHYKTMPVDVFINVSEYEGQPVAIKEAISFGIPIVATNVGGTAEIVSTGNGMLLSKHPSAEEIGNALSLLIFGEKDVLTMRNNSRRIFLEKHNSIVVYPTFVNHLKS